MCLCASLLKFFEVSAGVDGAEQICIVYIVADVSEFWFTDHIVLFPKKLRDRRSMETYKLLLSVKNVCLVKNDFQKAVRLFNTFLNLPH